MSPTHQYYVHCYVRNNIGAVNYFDLWYNFLMQKAFVGIHKIYSEVWLKQHCTSIHRLYLYTYIFAIYYILQKSFLTDVALILKLILFIIKIKVIRRFVITERFLQKNYILKNTAHVLTFLWRDIEVRQASSLIRVPSLPKIE